MGLCTYLKDVSSESIPLLLLAVTVNCVCYICSLLFGLFRWIGFSRFDDMGDIDVDSMLLCSSFLAEEQQQQQLNNMNDHGHVYSYYYENEDNEEDQCGVCIVCLSRLIIRDGDEQQLVVSKLACGHVFHKECLDGWLSIDHQKLNTCPLCRAPLDF